MLKHLMCLTALAAATAAHATSNAYAYAQRGFSDRILGQYTAEDTSTMTSARAGIGAAEIGGAIDTRLVASALSGTGGYSRTDFDVVGIAGSVPLTFTWQVQGLFSFTEGDASWGWDAFFGVTTNSPSGGGSYSAFGNQLTQGLTGSIGNPHSIVACNGNTRGQAFCGLRMDLSAPTQLSVLVTADHDTIGYIEQRVAGDGWAVEFGADVRLVSVTAPSLDAPAWLLMEDGSRIPISAVPEPGTAAALLLGLLGMGLHLGLRRRH